MEILEVKSVFYWASSLAAIMDPETSIFIEFKSTCFNPINLRLNKLELTFFPHCHPLPEDRCSE